MAEASLFKFHEPSEDEQREFNRGIVRSGIQFWIDCVKGVYGEYNQVLTQKLISELPFVSKNTHQSITYNENIQDNSFVVASADQPSCLIRLNQTDPFKPSILFARRMTDLTHGGWKNPRDGIVYLSLPFKNGDFSGPFTAFLLTDEEKLQKIYNPYSGIISENKDIQLFFDSLANSLVKREFHLQNHQGYVN